MTSLKDKKIVITGAGQGVGLGIATSVAKKGASVALLGRTFSKVEDAANNLKSESMDALAVECDVKDEISIDNAMKKVNAKFGSINVLINNAQEVPLGNILDISDDDFNNGWKSGPLATFRIMKKFYDQLKNGGHIINLASSSALRSDLNGYGAYAAVKEAIRSLSRAAAVEWGKDNIRVNCIMPLARSPGMDWWIKERPDESSEFIKSIPLQRVGDCEKDIGDAVSNLLSDGMKYITGSTIMLDGGQSYLR